MKSQAKNTTTGGRMETRAFEEIDRCVELGRRQFANVPYAAKVEIMRPYLEKYMAGGLRLSQLLVASVVVFQDDHRRYVCEQIPAKKRSAELRALKGMMPHRNLEMIEGVLLCTHEDLGATMRMVA
jgi:hypothetical protein